MEENYLVLTFDEIWEKLFVLAKKIRKDPFEPNLIIGILRGGLAISRILSDLLSINEVTTIGVGFYKGINEREKSPFLTEEINYELVNKKILLVDDVSDSGRSLDFAIKHLSKFDYLEMKTATIHYKPKSIFKPDFFISETDKWIVYPWEYMEFTKLYIAKRKSEGISEDIIKEQLLSLSIPALILKELL